MHSTFTKKTGFPVKVFVLLIFLASAKNISAQLTVTPGVASATLVASLIGQGMTVTNVTLNCPTNAYGTFANGNTTNMGIANGILLTTGDAMDAIGPNSLTSTSVCNNTSANDAQLISVEPAATLDPCILEFDVVPECNTLTINFVFGSEEYPEFVSQGFNDAFGFWITGAGPACQPGFYNNTNVATLPNNTTLVSIDNVNNVTNSAFYVDNTGGTTIEYDGFTTVLTRNILLCPCQSYHWKIAIADAGDCLYDSGVFIDFLSCSTALSATASSTPSSCTGCTGTATANATGQGPFTYTWAPSGGNAATASNLCAGTYTCTIDDAISCSPPTTVAVTVGSSATPITTTSAQANVSCNGACDGSASVNVTGGNGPFVYSWAPSGGNSSSALSLCPGTYTCTVTGAGGCTTSPSFTITQPAVLTASSVGTNITCFGGTNGTATATPAGGTSTYNYTWLPSGGNAATANNLAAGTYTCNIVDANGCTISTSITLTEPPAFTSSATSADILCFGNANGTATITPVGGAGSNTFNWLPSGGNAATATGLGAGTYTCTVTDIGGCTTTSSVTITEPPVLTLASSGLPATCNAACDGQLIVIPNGGTSPYNFLWSTGCSNPSCSNICAGSYTITVTDANGCSINNTVTVTEPTAITQNISSTPSNCNASDGTATTVANGGTGPYVYDWQPGGGNAALYANIPSGQYTITVTDANNCTSVDSVVVTNTAGFSVTSGPVGNATCNAACDGSLSATGNGGTPPFVYAWAPSGGNASAANNLCAGTYTCTITDANGCLTTVSFTVTEPGPLTVVTPAAPPVICAGANTTLSAVAAGGTGPYVYTWQPGNLAGSSPSVTPASTTTYTVTVTDANGCSATATELITVNPNPVVSLSGLPLSGCVPLNVTFSDLSTVTPPATITGWAWDFGDNSPISNVQNPSHTYLIAGNYNVTLTVTSSNGCTSTITLNNYVSVFPGPVAGFSASPQPASVIESTITFADQSSGATTWQWNFGDVGNSSSTLQNPSFTYPDTGCYVVQQIVISANQCTDTAESVICIDPDWSLYFPNAFTPDDDGINDFFIPVGVGISEDNYQLWIFDRWGNLIFTTDDLHKGWNGKVAGGKEICQIDTYVWKVKCKDVLGGNHKYVGKVSIIK